MFEMTDLSSSRPKKLALLAGVVMLAVVITTVYLVHYYGETRPKISQVQTGRIHPATIHGRTVYLTSGEYALAFATHALAIVAIGVFVGLLFKSIRQNT